MTKHKWASSLEKAVVLLGGNIAKCYTRSPALWP
jgi:hypothetical protein